MNFACMGSPTIGPKWNAAIFRPYAAEKGGRRKGFASLRPQHVSRRPAGYTRQAPRAPSELTRAGFHMWKNHSHIWKRNDHLPSEPGGDVSTAGGAPVVTPENALTEAQELIVFLADLNNAKSVKLGLRDAARLSGLPLARVNRLYYRKERTSVHAHELDQLRHRAEWVRAERIKRMRAELASLERVEGSAA